MYIVNGQFYISISSASVWGLIRDCRRRYWHMYISCISFFLSPGIIIRYELFMQLVNESQRNATSYGSEQRVFVSSGWLNPRPSMSSANENALTPPESSAVVSSLEPFSTYRFRVLTVNMAGSTLSEWAMGRTAEGGQSNTLCAIKESHLKLFLLNYGDYNYIMIWNCVLHFVWGWLFSFCFISEEIMKQIILNNTQNSLK